MMLITWAGQYREGYAEVLGRFLESVEPVLAAGTTLLLVLSPHARTDGGVER